MKRPDMMLWMHLAATLGMSLKRVMREVDSREFALWKARDRLSPLDHARRAELSAGILTAAVMAPYSSHPQPASAYMQDYAGMWDQKLSPSPADPTPEELAAKLDAIFGNAKCPPSAKPS